MPDRFCSRYLLCLAYYSDEQSLQKPKLDFKNKELSSIKKKKKKTRNEVIGSGDSSLKRNM